MDPLGVTLIFTLSGMTAWLLYAAAAALVWELLSLIGVIWRAHEPAVALPLTAASLAAGPITAGAAAIYGGMATLDGEPFRGRSVVWAGLRGTVVMLLGALVLLQACREASDPPQWMLEWMHWMSPRMQQMPNGALVAIALAAVLWAVRAYRRTTSPIKAGTKALLLALRVGVVLLVTAWAARPVLEYQRTVDVPGVVLVGIDASTSMSLRDMPADYRDEAAAPGAPRVSRIESVRQALLDNRDAFEAIAALAQLRVFDFAGEAGPARKFEPDGSAAFAEAFVVGKPTGRLTAIGDSAAAAADPSVLGQKHVAAVLLITDGCNNAADTIAPEEFAALMGSRGVPLYTVAVGSAKITGATRTLTVRELAAADEIEAFNRLPITAVVEAMGLAGRKITVTCRFGDKEVDTKRFDVTADHFLRPVRFEYVPLAIGFQRLVVQATCTGPNADKLSGEPRAGKLVHVVDRNLRILYVEGKFRYETKYISAALAGEKRFSVDRRILLQPLGKGVGDLSEDLDDWLTYHAIIFGDVSADKFTPGQLEIIKKLVGEYGKGFCMIGGDAAFGRGGWDRTAIADILGPDLARSKGQIDDEIAVEITPEGLDSEIMRIGPDPTKVAEAWRGLGTLAGANALTVTKPAARVLARSSRGEPLIVAQRYGSGRTLAVAFDTTWQWVLSPKDTAEMQKRFWRQVALFLCAPKGNVWIATDRPRYDHGRLLGHRSKPQTIRVTAGVEDPRGRPMMTAPVTVVLTGPDGKETPVILQAGKTMRRTILTGATAPGEYVLKIGAMVAGKRLSAEHRFEIIRRDLEGLDVLANFELLKRMADDSDGQFSRIGEMDRLLGKLEISAEPRQETAYEHDELASRFRWPIVAALIALLCLEWILRKRKGLV